MTLYAKQGFWLNKILRKPCGSVNLLSGFIFSENRGKESLSFIWQNNNKLLFCIVPPK